MPVRSENIRNNNISIRLLADGFSFAYTQAGSLQESYFLADPELSLAENLRTAIKQHQDLLSQASGEVSLIISTERYTVLPLALFSEADKEALFQASMRKEEDETIFHHTVKAYNQVFLFAAPSHLKDLFSELLPGREIQVFCQAALLLTQEEGSSPEPTILAHIQPELLTIQCVTGGNLTYSKAFSSKSNEDHLFYILSAVKALGLDQTTLEMKLQIACSKALPLASEMRLFIENINTTGPEQSKLMDHRICRQCV